MDDTIEARFVAETELLGLELLPGQKETLLAAYTAMREMVELVGADYPFETEPAHVFMPVPSGGDWSAGSNWSTGSVPHAGDDVRLVAEHAVKRKLVPRVGRETIRVLLQSHDLKPWREKNVVRGRSR